MASSLTGLAFVVLFAVQLGWYAVPVRLILMRRQANIADDKVPCICCVQVASYHRH